MLLDAAIVVLILAVTVGRGKLVHLKHLELRGAGVFMLAAVIKVALMLLAARGVEVSPALARTGNVISYLLLFVGLALNHRQWAFRVVALGVLLNFVVIAANGGSMPVDRDLAVRSGNLAMVELLDSGHYFTHAPVTAHTRLRFLADVFPLPLLVPRPKFYSPGSVGDVLITLGACWLILSATGAFGLGGAGQPAPARGRESAA